MTVLCTLRDQELHTVLAALRFYQRQGMGDPASRPDWLQEIACPDLGKDTSLDDEAIDRLCQRLNFSPGGGEVYFAVHEHRHGADVYPYRWAGEGSYLACADVDDVWLAEQLNIDFEPGRPEESLSTFALQQLDDLPVLTAPQRVSGETP